MNKNLIAAVAALTLTTSALADISITGNYEGTISDGNPGAATYSQELDLAIVGKAELATVTAKVKNVDAGDNITFNEVYVNTTIEGLDAKLGKWQGQNGAGLLQKKSASSNKMRLATSLGGLDVAVQQGSGDANASADIGATVGGVAIKVQNVINSDRFVSASVSKGGVDLNGEYQKTSVGTNIGGVASATVGGFGIAGALIDVEDTSAVTQDDDILEDISNAANGKLVKGVILTSATTVGDLTGKLINKNDKNTYVAKLERGIMEYKYSKTEDTDGIISAKLTLNF